MDNELKQKGTNEVPSWYPLSIYSKELHASDWYKQIKDRLCISDLADALSATDVSEENKISFRLNLKSYFLLVVVKGIRYENGQEIHGLGQFGPDEPVKDLTVYETAYLNSIPQHRGSRDWRVFGERMGQNLGSIISDDLARLEENREWGGAVLQRDLSDHPEDIAWRVSSLLNGRYPLSVNLEASDQVLISGFKHWLKEIRRIRPVTKNRPLETKDFHSWRKFKILETFDLQLWARLTGCSFTDSFLGKTLWADEYDVDLTERYRKVAKKNAQKIVSWATVNQIAADERLSGTIFRK